MGREKHLLFKLARAAAVALAAAAGFAIACVCAMRLLPEPDLPFIIREKIAHLAKHGDEYDAIFLGSSRIQNHVMPALFDSITARNGLPMKSFNFGISSMRAPEDDYLLDRILAQPHARLRWVFVEIDFFQTDIPADKAGTLQGLYWHDLPRFALLCRRLSLATKTGLHSRIRDAFERSDDFIDHAKLFLERSANSGRGAQLLERRINQIPPDPMNWDSLGKSGDGWVAAIPNENDLADQRSGHLGSILQERKKNPPERDEGDSASQSILASLLEKIVKAGATPVIVIPPRTRHYYFYPGPDLARRFPIIDFCDPAGYPDLYREDLRVDTSHLTAEGAAVFTRLTADAFLHAK